MLGGKPVLSSSRCLLGWWPPGRPVGPSWTKEHCMPGLTRAAVLCRWPLPCAPALRPADLLHHLPHHRPRGPAVLHGKLHGVVSGRHVSTRYRHVSTRPPHGCRHWFPRPHSPAPAAAARAGGWWRGDPCAFAAIAPDCTACLPVLYRRKYQQVYTYTPTYQSGGLVSVAASLPYPSLLRPSLPPLPCLALPHPTPPLPTSASTTTTPASPHAAPAPPRSRRHTSAPPLPHLCPATSAPAGLGARV